AAINSKPFIAGGFIYRGTFTPTVRRIKSPVEHYNAAGGWGDNSTQAKIHIRDDFLLTNTGSDGYSIYPMQVLPELEANEFGTKLSGHWSRQDTTLPHSARFEHVLFPTHRKHDVTLSGTEFDDGDKPSEQTYWRNARYDVEIAAEK